MHITNNILSVNVGNPLDVARQIAQRVKERRLELNLTQEGMAVRAGLKLPTYRRFERTGKISLEGLARIGFALNALHDFDALFSKRQYQSIDEILSEETVIRKRGNKNE